MTKSAEKLKGQLLVLSPEDRAELASCLLESLDEVIDDDAEAALDAKLARRAEEIKSGKVIGIPAEEVIAELREVPVKAVIYHPEARTELHEAAAYYESKRKGVGKRFRLLVRRNWP